MTGAASDVLIDARDINVSIGDAQLLSSVSLCVHKNELVGLIGPNGAGKSTLLNIIAGLSQPQSGQVELLNKPLSNYNSSLRAQIVSWLAQQGHVHWPINVKRLVGLGRVPHHAIWREKDRNAEMMVANAMTITECDHLAQRQFNTLSGGEQARVLMARALAADPTVLLADEPIASLDPGHQLNTMKQLRNFAEDGKGCITILHDLSLAARFCDTVYLLDKGNLVAHGSPSAVLTDENLEKVYRVKALRGDSPEPWLLPFDVLR